MPAAKRKNGWAADAARLQLKSGRRMRLPLLLILPKF
jgi:hypothetical protein